MIEFELACDSQVLSERFHGAAEQLNKTFSASNSSVERVQGQFLKGAWLKSESRIVESWHALGSTIREAQELGGYIFEATIRHCLTYLKDLTKPHMLKACRSLMLRFVDEFGLYSLSGTGECSITVLKCFA